MDITPEEAVGCERFKDRLRLFVSEGHSVEFELVEDPENDRLILGTLIQT